MKKAIYTIAILLVIAKIILVSVIFLYPRVAVGENTEINTQHLINLTNQYRQEQGLNELTINPRLTQAAVNKATDMLTRQYFNHTSPDGQRFSFWIKEVDYQYFHVGENLAIDFENGEEIFNAWLASPSHRDNIVKSQYQEIGIAVLEGKYKNHATVVVVQLFGTRVLGATEVTNNATNSNPVANYFYDPDAWQDLASLRALEKMNAWTSYLLIVFLAIALIIYRPHHKKIHKSIKQPIINRYQAKTFNE